ncbi:MAG: heavy metal-binding domain-containing protein [Eubacterium sp.]|nr:heavy metal-binding domain-containing protein [Eubacterium sp.]
MRVKTKAIANQCGLDKNDFEYFLKERYNGKIVFDGVELNGDISIKNLIDDYKFQRGTTDEQKQKYEEDQQKMRAAMSKMLITSGFTFDGYRIKKYSGYISGDDAVQVNRRGLFGEAHTDRALTDALVKIRRQALIELKEAAYNLGCNAVIGVDFDYITLEPETANYSGGTTYLPYVFCVTANGNAVVIEKIEDSTDNN